MSSRSEIQIWLVITACVVCTATLYGQNASMGWGAGFHVFHNTLQPPLQIQLYLATSPDAGPPTQLLPKPQPAPLEHHMWLLGTTVNTKPLMPSGTASARFKEESPARGGKGAQGLLPFCLPSPAPKGYFTNCKAKAGFSCK